MKRGTILKRTICIMLTLAVVMSNINMVALAAEGEGVNVYNAEGYDVNGYNAEGYDANGYDTNGYNAEGYDANGYDVNGYNAEGYDASGYDVNGYNAEGYDVSGYDVNGYNADGYDVSGYNVDGYDSSGFDVNGYDKAGNPAPTVTMDRSGFSLTPPAAAEQKNYVVTVEYYDTYGDVSIPIKTKTFETSEKISTGEKVYNNNRGSVAIAGNSEFSWMYKGSVVSSGTNADTLLGGVTKNTTIKLYAYIEHEVTVNVNGDESSFTIEHGKKLKKAENAEAVMKASEMAPKDGIYEFSNWEQGNGTEWTSYAAKNMNVTKSMTLKAVYNKEPSIELAYKVTSKELVELEYNRKKIKVSDILEIKNSTSGKAAKLSGFDITFSNDEGKTYTSTDLQKIKNQGTKTVYYKIKKDGYLGAIKGEVEVTINSIQIELTVPDQTITVGETLDEDTLVSDMTEELKVILDRKKINKYIREIGVLEFDYDEALVQSAGTTKDALQLKIVNPKNDNEKDWTEIDGGSFYSLRKDSYEITIYFGDLIVEEATSTQPGGDDDSNTNQPGGDDDSNTNQPGGDDDSNTNQPGEDDDNSANQPGEDDDNSANQPGEDDDSNTNQQSLNLVTVPQSTTQTVASTPSTVAAPVRTEIEDAAVPQAATPEVEASEVQEETAEIEDTQVPTTSAPSEVQNNSWIVMLGAGIVLALGGFVVFFGLKRRKDEK